MEKLGVPPPGYKPYQGGHFLAYDMATGKFENLGHRPRRRGHHHHEHGRRPRPVVRHDLAHRPLLFATTWPRRTMKNLGPWSPSRARSGKGRTIARCAARWPSIPPTARSISATARRHPPLSLRRDDVETVAGEDLSKDYFGLYDPTSPGHMGYNWRQVFWHPDEKRDLRRSRQLGLSVPLRSARAARVECWSGSPRSLEAQRHVRPVQLRLPGLHARTRPAHDLLPDRRPDLRRRQAGDRQERPPARARPRGWKTCT